MKMEYIVLFFKDIKELKMFWKLRFCVYCLLAFAFVSMADAQDVTWIRHGKIVTDSIYSKVLKTYRAYTIYLPKSYDGTQNKYPILYLLHGMTGINSSWFEGEHVQDVMDQFVASGEACEMIIVSPNAGGRLEDGCWNGYFNMPGWAYEDFFYQEFIPYIESHYRVMADKRHRAIAGLSMGGGGTTSYAQRHSDMFCAAYAMSALMDIPAGNEHPSDDPNSKMMLLTKSVMEHSCIKYVEDADEARKEELRSVKWFIDCGDDDFLFDRNIEFVQAMHKAQIPCEFRVRDGAHTSEYWHSALYTCLPFVTRSFAK